MVGSCSLDLVEVCHGVELEGISGGHWQTKFDWRGIAEVNAVPNDLSADAMIRATTHPQPNSPHEQRPTTTSAGLSPGFAKAVSFRTSDGD